MATVQLLAAWEGSGGTEECKAGRACCTAIERSVLRPSPAPRRVSVVSADERASDETTMARRRVE